MSESINVISERCNLVGKELVRFVTKLRFVTQKSFSRSLSRSHIGINHQKFFRLKYQYDSNQRNVGVYFKMRLPSCSSAVTYFKLFDNNFVLKFDATDDDLKRLFYFPIEINENTSTLLITNNFHDCLMISRLISELEIISAKVCCILNVDESLVHEQVDLLKPDLKNIVFVNQSIPSSKSLCLDINLLSYFEIGVDAAKSQFVKKLMSILKKSNDE